MHYIYTKEGIRITIGLKTTEEINRYKKKALKKGFKPSKIIAGVEYFDYEQLKMIVN